MRRSKGMGSVVKIGAMYYARKRKVGQPDQYGPARERQEDAEKDRLHIFGRGSSTVVKRRELPTLREWSFACLEGDYGASLAPSTHSTNSTIHMSVLECPELAAVSTLRLDKILPENIVWILSKIRVKKMRKVDGKIEMWFEEASPAWQHRVAAYLQRLFALAVARGFVCQSPFKSVDENGRKIVRLKKISERDNRILKVAEAEYFIQPDSRLECLLFIQLLAGLRTSELLSLQWSHVDFQEGTLRVPGTKTEDSKRLVIATPEMLAVILRQPRRSNLIFTTTSGKPISRHNYARDFARWKRERALPDSLRPQDLRGSHGNFILKATKNLKVTQRALRHGSLRTTASAYLRVDQDDLREAVELMTQSIGLANRVSRSK